MGDSSTSNKDKVVGWTSAHFKFIMGGKATYEQAAAGAVGIAIANALSANSDKTLLTQSLRSMDVVSFYGRLKWDSNGRIQKPMYTVQKHDQNMAIVAPTGNMRYPLSDPACWGPIEQPSSSRA